jgi:radical SAM protein with 4Fe4S-binding SPASM domain
MVSRLNMKDRPRRMPRQKGDFGHSPLIVFYEVTHACDSVCAACQSCAQPTAHPDELRTAQSLRLIDELNSFPLPPLLALIGGDPFKRADIFTIIEHAARRFLEVSITLSATSLVTSRSLGRLRCAGTSRIVVKIDGADAQTHDTALGVCGSYYRTLQILDDARANGIPAQVDTTLTPANYNQIDRLADMLARQHIAMWSVCFLVPTGRANQLSRLSAEQCEDSFRQLWQQSKRQPYPIKTTEAPHYRRFVVQHRPTKTSGRAEAKISGYLPLGINDGKGVMFVGHTGKIYPSVLMPLHCGTFPRDPVVRVYQESPIFRALRDADRLEGKCRACEFRHVCGGSRARAYAVTGNSFAEEPDCAYVPERTSAIHSR